LKLLNRVKVDPQDDWAGAGSGWMPDFTMDVSSCMIPPEPAIAKIARLRMHQNGYFDAKKFKTLNMINIIT
jgi:hypothetical protein